MNEEKLISVIVPIYRIPEKLLRRCIESIINQTYTNLEIILINDNSPDNSKKIISEYAHHDNRIIIMDKVKNESVSSASARNDGLSICHGNYFTFVDADDYIVCDRIEHLLKLSEDNSADIVVSSFDQVTEEGTLKFRILVPEKIFYLDNPNDRLQALPYLHYTVWSKLFRTDAFQNLKFKKLPTVFGGDVLFSIECFLKAKIMYTTSEASYKWVSRLSSMSNSEISLRYIDTKTIVCKLVKQLFELHNLPYLYNQYYYVTVYQEITLLSGMIANIENKFKKRECFAYLKNQFYKELKYLVPKNVIYDPFYRVLFCFNNPKLMYFLSYFIYNSPIVLIKRRLTTLINKKWKKINEKTSHLWRKLCRYHQASA